MILFHAKRDGTVTTTPNLVPQGSSMQDFVVVSEFDYAYCAIRLLPASGVYLEDVPCTPILQSNGGTLWTASLPPEATVVAGAVEYQLIFTAADGATQTTLVGSFSVPRGVLAATPPTVGELSSKSIGDLYTVLGQIYALFSGHEGDINKAKYDITVAFSRIGSVETDLGNQISINTEAIAQNQKNTSDKFNSFNEVVYNLSERIAQNKELITAFGGTIASAGYVTIPVTEWEDGTPTIASFNLDGFGLGMTALLIPVSTDVQNAAREARLSAYPVAFQVDEDTQKVDIIRANAEKAPEIPLCFAYVILKTASADIAPTVAIIGVDAYGSGGADLVDQHNKDKEAHPHILQLVDAVEKALSGITDTKIHVLDELPALADAVVYNFYLILGEDKEQGDLYDEYICLQDKDNVRYWEYIGTRKIDLSNYMTSAETSAEIARQIGLIQFPQVPEKLPNPQPIKIFGKTYDGSAAVTVTKQEIVQAVVDVLDRWEVVAV